MAAKVYAVANQKGGVGKSTTCQTLAAGLHDRGKKVLLIDLDPQSNLSTLCQAVTDAQKKDVVTMLEILIEENSIAEGIQHKANFDIIPASMFLASIDGRLPDQISRPYKLAEAIKPISKQYDYIIVDTPPALGTLTVNAIIAADYVLIPAQADILSLQGVSQLHSTMQAARKHANKGLKIAGIILTRYNGRTNLSKDIALLFQSAAGTMKTKVFESRIRENTALKEAQSKGMDIFTYDKKSNAAKDYEALIDEIFGGEK